MANSTWKEAHPDFKVRHLPRYKSDHSPLLLSCDAPSDANARRGGRHGFRLEHMWLDHPNFVKILKDSWRDTTMMDNFGEKVGKCGADLSRWASKEFGSVRRRKKKLTETLLKCQDGEENDQKRQPMQAAERELDHVLKLEETMWHQRSRVLWLKDGDRNSAYFHQKASNRKRRNTIDQISDGQGNVVKKEEEIEKVIREYYTEMFTSEKGGDVNNVIAAV